MLIIFSGLPGSGKTSIARELARQLGAMYLRIDSIEQAMEGAAGVTGPLNDTGYRVGYAVAEDNLRIGRTVVADSVNPLALTRDAWAETAKRAHARAVEVEVTCSDTEEHRRRVETRAADIPEKLPNWNDVVSREYHAWGRDPIVVDTAGQTVEQCVSRLREALPK